MKEHWINLQLRSASFKIQNWIHPKAVQVMHQILLRLIFIEATLLFGKEKTSNNQRTFGRFVAVHLGRLMKRKRVLREGEAVDRQIEEMKL